MSGSAVVSLVGKLSRDIELRYMPSGAPVTNISIAVDTGWGDKKVTTWYTVAVFGKRAEQCVENLRKGSTVHVVGEQHIESWTRQDGTASMSIKVNASIVDFISDFGKNATRAMDDAKLADEEVKDEDISF